MSKYSFDSLIGDLMEDPKVMELVNEIAPELLDHPMKDIAKPFPAKMALPFVEGMFTEEQIEEFKRRLEAIE